MAEPSRPLIRTVDVTRDYRLGGATVRALRGVSLTIHRGEFVAVMGPSGSGKSTLLNLLGCLDRPSSGRYLLDGRDLSRLDSDARAAIRSRKVGLVFQSFNLLGRSTAIENVELPLVYGDAPRAKRRARAAAALAAVGLGHRRDHWPRQLSGGEQQRVAIARALVNDPLLLLADEPTGALDSGTGLLILATFQALNRAGRTIVLVTHDATVARHARRIVAMHDGRVVRDEPVAAPADAAAALPPAGDAAATAPEPGRPGRGMSTLEGVRIALRALRVNALRSLLTMLGIVIGVAAVIAMAAVGGGARSQVEDQIRSLGSNLLLVLPGSASSGGARLGAGSRPTLTEDDAAAMAREVSAVRVAAPTVSGSAHVVRGGRNWSTLIAGVVPDYLIARDWRVDNGRPFTLEEQAAAAKVALLGATVAGQLFEAGEDPLGQAVRIGNVPFTVVGVLAAKGQASGSGRDQDDVALIPLSTAKLRVLGGPHAANRAAVDFAMVKVADADVLAAAREQIRALLRQRHRLPPDAEDDFQLRDPAAAMEARAAATRSLSLLLAAVASVSLVVGGISIMNIMVVSVTERTREIGIRLAVGARRRDVRRQFLIEAATLCLLGGFAGVALGAGAAVAIARLAGWPILISPAAVLLAVAFAGAVGVFFGLYPALKASRLDPIEALRFE